jgi:hypothetical protein
VQQALGAVRLLKTEEAVAERVLRRVTAFTATADLSLPPPYMGREIHRIIREETGSPDPYAEMKQASTRQALALHPRTAAQVKSAADPFGLAVRMAIAGNVMDFALAATWDAQRIEVCLAEAADKPLDPAALDALRKAVAAADSILYLGDNAGETVFDRLLLDFFPKNKTAYAVKSGPVINDATRKDAEEAGIDKDFEVVENGSDAPGTVLELCSESFRRRFEAADLVVAKGQANYETLSDIPREMFFLTQVKCPVLARDLEAKTGDWIVKHKPPADRSSAKRKSVEAFPKVVVPPVSSFMKYKPIGVIHSEHQLSEKTPIQPAYAGDCEGWVEVLPEFVEGLRDLEGFSHVQLIYHLHRAENVKLVVKPFIQDIGRGIFATRAPCRPNPIGLSIVSLIRREGNVLRLKGLDILDGTPLLDIKPYVARFDRIENTRHGWQDEVTEKNAQKRGKRGYRRGQGPNKRGNA